MDYCNNCPYISWDTDCISRQAVEEMIKAEMPERGMWEIEGDKVKETVCEVCVDLMQKLSELPPVTPTVSEDCISRQEVLDELKEVPFILHYNCDMEQDELVDTIEEQIRECTKRMIEALPPITPPKGVVAQISIDTEELIERIKEEYEITDKVGEWVRQYCFQQWKCSECEYEIGGKTNYCPNCGAKMKRSEWG